MIRRIIQMIQGERPPSDTPEPLRIALTSPSFWRNLDDAYYKNRQDEWENEELYVSYESYGHILEGAGNTFPRGRLPDEELTEDGIVRAGRVVWRIGRTYNVCDDFKVKEGFERKDSVVGRIRLIDVQENTEFGFMLYFEVAE